MSEDPYEPPSSQAAQTSKKSNWRKTRNISGLVFISTLIGGRIWSKIITIKYRNATSIEEAEQLSYSSLWIGAAVGLVIIASGLLALISTLIAGFRRRS
jgi:hypothetical protein